MTGKTLAILCYIDDTPKMIEEFGWLYRSWIYSGNWRTSDIIAICNPTVIEKLPKDPGITFIERHPLNVPGSRWADYKFINSINCLIGEHTKNLPKYYTHILRTDADVFLCPALSDLRPNFYVHGRGRYIQTAETQSIIADFARRHGFNHHGVFNCGHSILGPAEGVLKFLSKQSSICDVLLDEFGENQGEWPRWWRGTITMYAAEIAANDEHYHYLYSSFLNVLDFESEREDRIIESNIAHIHASHTHDYFSKFEFRAGKYQNIPTDDLDRSRVNTYCHWIAVTPTEIVKQLCQYPS